MDKLSSPLVFLLLFALAAVNPAKAQDVEAGERIARSWCSNCHMVDFGQKGGDAVPSFATIAHRASTTEMSLRAILSIPHGRMPDFSLTRTEIHNVSAYILSLRDHP